MEVNEFKLALWNITREITENINQIFYPIAERYGLTLMQIQLLLNLLQDEEHTIGSLGKCMRMAGGNISNLCKKLEKEGFVERCRNVNDERVVIVTLSAKGRQTISEIDRAIDRKYELLLEKYAEESLTEIVSGLKRLNLLLERISTLDD
ncbi:MAG: MarR family winged helix-turn-helix transcriptional regulator [Dethiobacteraceae bacterium]|jgi:DNA-binding MarR family transcriptional regulator|nr:MarR family transcriptional regulator [Bacillota bacterium]